MRAFLLGLCLVIGLGLRLWSASTTVPHGDERHYAGDAGWSVVEAPGAWRWPFVHAHAIDHPYLDWKRATVGRWADERTPRGGHPFLFPLVTGAVLAVVRPDTLESALHVGRVVNAVADASTILLLPLLTSALGAPPVAGIVAAALYAVFPPAATYGGLALLEPLSAPLVVLLFTLLLRRRARIGPALGAGLVTGLLLTSEIWTVAVLPVVVLILLTDGAHRLRDLAAWLVTGAVTLVVLTSPVAFLAGFGSDAFRVIRADVIPTLRHNLGFVADPQGYYFLGFAKHGFPMAHALARLHGLLTPAMLVLFVASLMATILRQRSRELIVLYLPILLILALTPPSDGIFRLHQGFPLACAAMGIALASLGALGRVALVIPAVIAGLLPIMPDRLNHLGQVNLANMLLVNPGVQAPHNFYSRENPLKINLAPGMLLTRRLLLPPGRYDVRVLAEGWPEVKLDDHTIIVGKLTFGSRKRGDTVDLEGWVHRLELSSPVAISKYGAVVIRPHVPDAAAPPTTTTQPPAGAPTTRPEPMAPDPDAVADPPAPAPG